mmetsp:Transcript_48361/g.114674  ORF Transcript_48361/g.114674 Transcript_48361/m.114674 type:complete len:609 (-) Transcript_48361:764-2590(-)
MREHNVGGRAGRVGGAGHRNADVSALERRRVVDAVACHRGHLPGAAGFLGELEALDDLLLVEGLGAGEERRTLHALHLLPLRHRTELPPRVALALHLLVVLEHADLAADALGGLLVVARDDDDADAGAPARLDRRPHLDARRVQDAHQADEGHVALELHEALGVGQAGVGGVHAGGDGVREAPQRVGARPEVALDFVDDVGAHGLGHGHGEALGEHHARAARHDALRGPLHQQLTLPLALAALAPDDDAHALAVAAELEGGEERVAGGVGVVGGGARAATALARPLRPDLLHSNLERRLRALPHTLPHARLGARDAREVAEGHDLGELAEDRVLEGLDLAPVEEDVAAGLVRDALHVQLQLGLDSVGEGVDLLDAHLVRRQRPRLVRADHRAAPQRLHRRQVPDEGVALGHAAGAEGEAGGDDCREALRDGGDRQRDRLLEVEDAPEEEAPPPPVRPRLHLLRDHLLALAVEGEDVDEPAEDADDGDDVGKLLPEVVQLLLERRRRVLRLREALGDLADLGADAGLDDDAAALAVHHVRPREQAVALLLQLRVHLLHHHVEVLVDGGAFASQRRLLNLERRRLHLHHPHVRRHLVSDVDLDNVARHDL